MKITHLKQPFAQMVATGIIDGIPFITETSEDELILIYAERQSSLFKDGFDLSRKLNRLVLNQMMLGNLTEDLDELPVNCFVGYVYVSHPKKNQEIRPHDPEAIHVHNAHLFDTPVAKIKDYQSLKTIPSKAVKPNKIYLNENGVLRVPVSKSVWEELNGSNSFENIYLFWEDYMIDFVQSLHYSDKCFNVEYEDILDVSFYYQTECINFESDGVEQGYRINPKKKYILTLEFNLKDKSEAIRSFYSSTRKKKFAVTKDNEDRNINYLRMIYTPMGGMTQWKRKK